MGILWGGRVDKIKTKRGKKEEIFLFTSFVYCYKYLVLDGKETTLNMMIFQKTNNIWKAGSGRRFSEAVSTTYNFIERPLIIGVIKKYSKLPKSFVIARHE